MFKSKFSRGIFGAIASLFAVSESYGGGNQSSRYIRNHKSALVKCGSTKYIDHAKVRQLRMECAAHNELLSELKQAGILSKAGNVKEISWLDAYNKGIAARAKKINLA